MPGWRAAGFRLEDDFGRFVKGRLVDDHGYSYEFFHRKCPLCPLYGVFLVRFGVDRRNLLLFSMPLSKGGELPKSLHLTGGRLNSGEDCGRIVRDRGKQLAAIFGVRTAILPIFRIAWTHSSGNRPLAVIDTPPVGTGAGFRAGYGETKCPGILTKTG